jgi:pilus assembly protein CpaB
MGVKAARLIVLAVAFAAGGAAAVLASRDGPVPDAKSVQEPATVDVLVAKSNIAVGQRITRQDVIWQAWPAQTSAANFIRRKEYPNALKELAGSIVRAPFFAGEPIHQAKLVAANGSGYMAAILPSGMRAVSVRVSPESGASGFILPNDHVDVIFTRRNSETKMYTSRAILSDVRVLAIDQEVGEKDGQKVVLGKTATLELTPAQVFTIELARQLAHGGLALALRSMADIGKGIPKSDSPKQDAAHAVKIGPRGEAVYLCSWRGCESARSDPMAQISPPDSKPTPSLDRGRLEKELLPTSLNQLSLPSYLVAGTG